MTTFNPDDFMNTAETGALSTTFEPIPDGEYKANIGSDEKAITLRETQSGRVVLDVTWELLEVEELRVKLGRDKLTVRQSIFLDMTPQRTLDRGKGKNVQLGRLREALNQNDPTRPWMMSALRGAGPAKIRITSREADGNIYNDVKAVTRVA